MSDAPDDAAQLSGDTVDTAEPRPDESSAGPNPREATERGPDTPAPRPILVPVIAALAAGALIGGISGAGVTLWANSLYDGTPISVDSGPATITVNDPDDATLVTAVAAKSAPSVVTIAVRGESAGGSGSGVILTEDGYILTNNHVVTLDGATARPDITVTTREGRLLAATIVGSDPIFDLAVIKVDAEGLPAAEFADSSELNVGDRAIAIGAPLGLAGTVTDGIVSALNRSITVASSALPDEEQLPDQPEPEEESDPFDFFNFDIPGQSPSGNATRISLAVIQTDAAINPGNSGGALLDSDGRVIGINVAIASASANSGAAGNIGVGFAIPSNVAKRIAGELMETGSASHGLLGATVTDVTDDKNQADAEVVGASIVELTPDGAAEAAGLRVGDIVTRFNGIPITNKTDLTAQVRSVAAGADATITAVRDGNELRFEVTLGQLK